MGKILKKTAEGRHYLGDSMLLLCLWLFLASTIEYLQMETCLLSMDMAIPLISLPLFFLNLSLIVFLHLFLCLVTGRWKASFYLSAIFFFLWGIADYYTILYHGSPLFFSELGNVGAALAVSGGYRLGFHEVPALIILAFGVEIVINIYMSRWFGKRGKVVPSCPMSPAGLIGKSQETEIEAARGKPGKWKSGEWKNSRGKPGKWKPGKWKSDRSLGLVLTTVGSLTVFLLGFHLLHIFGSDYILGWKWYDNVRDYGFICCAAEDARNTIFPFTSHDPYKNNPLCKLEKDYREEGMGTVAYPDLILIVNESFFDLDVCMDMETDKDYLKDYYSVDGAVYGYAECPNIGGRTNDSEYELLTSCSMDRLRASAPFNYLDLTQGPSLARFLGRLGYGTTAMHCGQPAIYSRDTGFRDLGFQKIILGQDNFHYHGKNGSREWLDEDNYRDLICHYDEKSSAPQFFYLLTYQNHGGYDQNESRLDTIHPSGLPEDLREQVGEYMSSASLSAKAFHWLTDYYARLDRPVVICMVGDHAPSFIHQLASSAGKGGGSAMRLVPFVIWNNAGIDMAADRVSWPASRIPELKTGGGISGMDMTEYMPFVLGKILMAE